jgi:uncharacterized membrane protein YphA (DoxX/SURF4 family)
MKSAAKFQIGRALTWQLFSSAGLHVFYFLILYIGFQVKVEWNISIENLLYLLIAPERTILEWFPNQGLQLLKGIWSIRVGVMAIGAALTWLFLTKRERLARLLRLNHHVRFDHALLQEVLALGIYLGPYLLAYFLLKSCFPKNEFGQFQIWVTRGWLLQLIFQSAIFGVTRWETLKGWAERFFLTPSGPYGLAILRVIFSWWSIQVYEGKLLTMLPTVSLKTKVGLPLVGWLIDIIPVGAELYTVFVWVGVTACWFVIFGFKTRWALIVNAVCCFYIIAVPNFFGKLWHEQLIIWISWILALSNCFDVLSIDSLIGKRPFVRSPNYTFPIRLIWIQLAVIYFWAGFYKFWDCGFDWALGQTMINQVQLEWLQHYDKVPELRLDLMPNLLKFGGFLVVLFELVYVLLIIRSKTRWFAVIGGLAMHNLIGYLMYISFFHMLQVFYIFYLDFNRIIPFAYRPAKVVRNYAKPAFLVASSLVMINFLFGMFSIDSYPFSAYPKYAATIPEKIEIIYFEAIDQNGNQIDVHAVGKENNFRWESYGWLEYGILQDMEKEDVTDRVKDYWNIWKAHNPQLGHCTKVDAWVIVRPVSPEGKFEADTLGLISTVLP